MIKQKSGEFRLPLLRITEWARDGNTIHASLSNADFLKEPAVPSPEYVPNCAYCGERDKLRWVGNFYSYAEEVYYPFYVCEIHDTDSSAAKAGEAGE